MRLFLIKQQTAILNLRDGQLISPSQDKRQQKNPTLRLKEISPDHAQNNHISSQKRQASSVVSCPFSIQSQNDSNVHKLSKILRKNFQKLEEERLRLQYLQEKAIEWKEIARRLV